MAKEVLLNINVDTDKAKVSVDKLGKSVENLEANVEKSEESASKSAKAFRKLGDGVRALAGATILLKAFDIAVDTFKELDQVARFVEKSIAAVKAAFFTLAPIIENFAKATLALLTGEFEEAGKFAGIFTDLLSKSVDTYIDLNNQAQKTVDLFRELRDAERELNVEVAKRQALIEKNKFISDDETKSIQERIDAAKIAFQLEAEIARERIKIEEERIRLILSDPTKDPTAEAVLNDLAAAKIAIYQAQNDQFSKQTELNNKINQLQKEAPILDDNFRLSIVDGTKTLEDEKRSIILRSNSLTNEELAKQNDAYWAEQAAKRRAENIQLAQDIASYSQQALMQVQGFGDLIFANRLQKAEKGSKYEQDLLEKQWKFNKKLQLAAAIIDGGKAITNSLAQSPVAIGPVPNPAGIASLAFAASTTALNIAKIASTKYDAGGGGGAPSISIPTFGATPQPTVNVGNINEINNQPIQAYISATDVSNALEARKMINDKNKL